MTESDFLYYYSKHYVSVLNDLIEGEESWHLADSISRYNEIVDTFKNINSEMIKAFNISDISELDNKNTEKSFIKLGYTLRQKSKEIFFERFSSELSNGNMYPKGNVDNLIKDKDIKSILSDKEKTLVDFIKRIRECEKKYLLG